MFHEWNEAELRGKISKLGQEAAGLSQVAERQRRLLPTRLAQLQTEYRKQGRPVRGALTDPRLRDFIDDVVELAHKARNCRVQWEACRMLFQARQSQQSWRRARLAWQSQELDQKY